MKANELQRALNAATAAARAAGAVMRKNLRETKKINAAFRHDLKLELDVRCQKIIEQRLGKAFPHIAFLGEEGETGDTGAEWRWVVDPIDGTVNFAYGIPHSCSSIALQRRVTAPIQGKAKEERFIPPYETQVGVVYNPFCDEIWTAVRGGKARLNGRVIQVSQNTKLGEAIVAMGFSKRRKILEQMLPSFAELTHRVRKVRMMGAAALDIVYVACGRMDAYIETGVRLWDIAAGALILECAGGEFWHEPIKGEQAFRVIATNGKLRQKLLAHLQ